MPADPTSLGAHGETMSNGDVLEFLKVEDSKVACFACGPFSGSERLGSVKTVIQAATHTHLP